MSIVITTVPAGSATPTSLPPCTDVANRDRAESSYREARSTRTRGERSPEASVAA
jgi:hypothetical protein